MAEFFKKKTFVYTRKGIKAPCTESPLYDTNTGCHKPFAASFCFSQLY